MIVVYQDNGLLFQVGLSDRISLSTLLWMSNIIEPKLEFHGRWIPSERSFRNGQSLSSRCHHVVLVENAVASKALALPRVEAIQFLLEEI